MGEWGSATRSGKLCGLDPLGTGEPDVALWRAKVVTPRALLKNLGWRSKAADRKVGKEAISNQQARSEGGLS